MDNPSESKDFYVDHLAEVNKTNQVLTTEDICNDKGMIIVPKGTPITPDVAEKIARFKLLAPLENSVNLDKTITPKRLHHDITKINAAYQKLGASSIAPINDKLKKQCMAYGNYPLLSQKLTVMAERLPRVYKDSLLTSVLALQLADELNMDQESTTTVFLGAQMHDAGLLNISPELVHKTGRLTTDEWKTIQGHVAIGRYFLDLIPGLPKKAGRAVFEHHERIDGTGYPLGKTAEKICLESQVIAAADAANAIYHQRLKPRGYLVKDCIPILQMIGHVYPKEIHDALIRIMQSSNHPPKRAVVDDRIPEQANFMLVSQKILSHWFEMAHQFVREIAVKIQAEKSRQSILMLHHLEKTIRSSGLFSTELRDWLKQVIFHKTNADFQDIEYTSLMFDELGYQLKQLYKMVTALVAAHGDEPALLRCSELGELIHGFPNQKWHEHDSEGQSISQMAVA